MKPVARTKMLNFAAENVKRSKTVIQRVSAAEGVQDDLAIVAETSDTLDLHHILAILSQKCLFL